MLAIPRRRISISWGLIKIFLNFIVFSNNYKGCRNKFEKEFSDYLGVKFSLGVSSARRAMAISLTALGLKPGDEVILASLNYFAIPAVIEALGIKAVFVDVEEDTGNINPKLIEKRITLHTKAIIVTHLFGRTSNIGEVVKIANYHNLFLIEDCAQSLGAEYKGSKCGTFGDVSIFSFSVGKSIMCLGGGMLVVKNSDILEKVKQEVRGSTEPKKSILIREFFKHWAISFSTQRLVFSTLVLPLIKIGYLFWKENIVDIIFGEKPKAIAKEYLMKKENRLTDFQAALGLEQLERLDADIKIATKNSQRIYENLSDSGLNLRKSKGRENIYSNYKIRTLNGNILRKKLINKGIGTQREAMQDSSQLSFIKSKTKNCSISESLSHNLLGIPNYPGLNNQDIDYVCREIKNCL